MFLLFCGLFPIVSHAQLTDGVTGLLHVPSAEMQKDGTLMVGGNFMNKYNIPSQRAWGYDTYNYYINVTFLEFIEAAYVCTLLKGKIMGIGLSRHGGSL